jgi:hypothetical protein
MFHLEHEIRGELAHYLRTDQPLEDLLEAEADAL